MRSTVTLVFKSVDYVFRNGEALRVHGEHGVVAEKPVEPPRPYVPRFGIMIYCTVVPAVGSGAIVHRTWHIASDGFAL